MIFWFEFGISSWFYQKKNIYIFIIWYFINLKSIYVWLQKKDCTYPFALNLLKINSKLKKKIVSQQKYYQKLENHIFQLYHSLFSIYFSYIQRVISRSSLHKIFNIGSTLKILGEILDILRITRSLTRHL